MQPGAKQRYDKSVIYGYYWIWYVIQRKLKESNETCYLFSPNDEQYKKTFIG